MNSDRTHRQLSAARRPMPLARLLLLAGISAALGLHGVASAQSGVGHYASVNGLQLYYEVYGQGQPLILLHGGLGSIEMFSPILPQLAKGRQVIAVDLQGHGRTADANRPLSYEAMADDVAALLRSLKLNRADVMGYSLGGEVALQTAIRHPEAVRKLVLVSTAFRQDGWYPEVLAGEAQMGPQSAEMTKQTPLYTLYAQLAPRPQDWTQLHYELHDLLTQNYDWSKGVAALKMPILLVVGDSDAVWTNHAVQFFELLGGGQKDGGYDGSGMAKSQLAILPGLTHYTIFASPALATTVTPFLDAPTAK